MDTPNNTDRTRPMNSQLTIQSVAIKSTRFGTEYAEMEAMLHVKADNSLKPVRVFAFDKPFGQVRKYLSAGRTLRLSTVWDGRGANGIGILKIVGPGRYLPRPRAA